jgi:hypothetical protein
VFLAEKQQIPIDYRIVNIDSWEEHLTHWYDTFSRLLLANLIVNLGKSDFVLSPLIIKETHSWLMAVKTYNS